MGKTKGFARLPLLLSFAVISTGCSSAMDMYKYMLTEKEGAVPARTTEAAQAQFEDGKLLVGQSTEADLKAVLGAPAEIKKTDTQKVYVYTKNISTRGVSVDAGTTYSALYTFNASGKLTEKEYAARPMGSSLPQQ